MQSKIETIAVLIASATVMLAASAAFAQSLPLTSATPAQDRISRTDQQTYERFDFTQRFGVQFRPHEAVCDTSVAGAIHCDSRVITPSRRPERSKGGGGNAVPPPPAGAYGPAQFLAAYQLSGVSSASKPPVIAIVDAYDDPNIASDLAAYSSAYGIPSLPTCSGPIADASTACFQKVDQNGSTSSFPRSNSGWALEISLDVEVAHATCQNCSILLVEASSNSYADLMAAEDRAVALGASVVSNSWGSSEFSGESSYDSHFDHPGVAFTFSAGDNGYGVEYPAASPYVTAVGGTSLFLNSNGTYNQEYAWSGTGSGCSAYESKPAWQTDSGCSRRTVTDVSADADPNTGAAVYDTVRYSGQSGWFQVGGTSLSSPIIASTYAQSGVISGTQENSLPYSNASATDLHDVTNGSNGSCGSYLCTAEAGYDGPTGLGTPLGTAAFSQPTAPDFSLSVSPTSVTVPNGGGTATSTVTVVPVSGFSSTVQLSLSGLPNGASYVFDPDPTAGSSELTVSVPAGTAAGSYPLVVTGVSTSPALSHTAALTLTVEPPPAAPVVSISATPSSIYLGQSSTLSWSSTDATSCIASGDWSGAEPVSGSLTVTPGAIGSYTYTLACTGSGGTATSSAALSVSAASTASFTLSADPTSFTVSPGWRGDDTITVSPSGGFSGSVSLAASGLPSGVRVSFRPSSTTSSSDMRLSVSRRTAAGTYTLHVTGTSGSLSSSVDITLVVL